MNKILYTILSIFIFTEVSFAAMSGGSSSSSSSPSSTSYSSSSSDDSGPYSPTSRFQDIIKLIKSKPDFKTTLGGCLIKKISLTVIVLKE